MDFHESDEIKAALLTMALRHDAAIALIETLKTNMTEQIRMATRLGMDFECRWAEQNLLDLQNMRVQQEEAQQNNMTRQQQFEEQQQLEE